MAPRRNIRDTRQRSRQDRDAIAGLNAGGSQHAGETRYAVLKLRPGLAAVLIDSGDTVRVDLARASQPCNTDIGSPRAAILSHNRLRRPAEDTVYTD